MIIYATFSNQGGMKRVAEAQLQQQFLDDVYFFLFCEKKPDPLPANHFWIKWRNVGNIFSPEQVEKIISEIKRTLPDYKKIKYVIGDYFTLPYFHSFDVQFIYDCHSLSLPLHQKLQEDMSFLTLDKLTKFPTSGVIRLSQIQYSKAEYSWLKKSIAFISNSKNTTRYLRELYPEAVGDKPIFEIPVISFIKPPAKVPAVDRPFFAFSRWHPQKGYHLLFTHNWLYTPLYIRGINPQEFLDDGIAELKARGIHLLSWSDDSESLASELLSAEVILFPAIYEPYGLALEEALSLGCLCVANKNDSGHEEQITHGYNGIILDFTSSNFLQELMAIYEMEPEAKKIIKERARTTQRASLQDRQDKLLRLFQWLKQR